MKKVVLYYYGFNFFFALLFWVPIFYEYQKQIGLNDSQIFGIQSAYYIAFALMEFPTGMLADRFGYRLSMRSGALVLVVANLLPIVIPNYLGFYCHFMFIGLARSLVSGASSAYLYDFLQKEAAVSQYKTIEGRARSYSLLGRIICWAVVGWLMQWHFTSPYWLTTLSALIAVGFAFAMPKVLKNINAEDRPIKTNAWNRMREVFGTLRSSPVLLLVMIQGTAVFILVRIVQVNLFQPILGAKQFSLTSYGLIMSLTTIFEAVGSAQLRGLARFAPVKLSRLRTDRSVVSLFSLVMGLSVIAIAYADRLWTVVSLIIFSFATGLIYPVQRQLMNDQITKPEYRATLLSIESIIDRSICAAVAWALGLYLASGRLNEFLLQSGIATFILIIALFFAFKLVRRTR